MRKREVGHQGAWWAEREKLQFQLTTEASEGEEVEAAVAEVRRGL